jgi:ribosomal protein S14
MPGVDAPAPAPRIQKPRMCTRCGERWMQDQTGLCRRCGRETGAYVINGLERDRRYLERLQAKHPRIQIRQPWPTQDGRFVPRGEITVFGRTYDVVWNGADSL